ncbi:hypothetical protein H3H37_24630 [Duganella sp. LX20W]|uniref:Uncharacterized protein n=1 Tax=Rugamonas brunnea TaxID=2758569 RepID=A0A7W2IE53_9BURK|nr:hypothetical protein [Rugamonas brunnea]MBA5640256.1 hypothetical protein [Rugamonas brunnea]
MKSSISEVRRAHRVIRMVAELHRMGYQRLRIMPFAHPNAWRLVIGSSEIFSDRNGAFIRFDSWDGVAIYSSAGGGDSYFEWGDAKTDNARQLAEKFVERFPELVEKGAGRDWGYAGWLAELVGRLEGSDIVPVTYWEYMVIGPEELTSLPLWTWPGTDTGATFPLPPLAQNVSVDR